MSSGPKEPGRQAQWLAWARSSAPYFSLHRGQTFVVYLSNPAVIGRAPTGLAQDIALLAYAGVRLILAFDDPRPPGRRGEGYGPEGERARVTSLEQLAVALERDGRTCFELGARLSSALAVAPIREFTPRIVSGSFVRAKPIGIRHGLDCERAGEVRNVDANGLAQCLDAHQIVLLPPNAPSPSGELFEISGLEVARACAGALRASKLIVLQDRFSLRELFGHCCEKAVPASWRELSAREAREALARLEGSETVEAGTAAARQIRAALDALQAGVRRVHILDVRVDGALLLELFTRDGAGTLITNDSYDETRRASQEDIAKIVALIEPLERAGALVPRSRDRLEREIGHYFVMERDAALIGCVAVLPLGESGGNRFAELACLAVDSPYRNSDRGERLLRLAEQEAARRGATHLVALTTQTAHWFEERGFQSAGPETLPPSRRATYDHTRRSRVLLRKLPERPSPGVD